MNKSLFFKGAHVTVILLLQLILNTYPKRFKIQSSIYQNHMAQKKNRKASQKKLNFVIPTTIRLHQLMLNKI